MNRNTNFENGNYNFTCFGKVINPANDYEYATLGFSYQQMIELRQELDACIKNIFQHDITVSSEVFAAEKINSFTSLNEHPNMNDQDILVLRESSGFSSGVTIMTGNTRKFIITSHKKSHAPYGTTTFMELCEI